jgi:hypothetical protein
LHSDLSRCRKRDDYYQRQEDNSPEDLFHCELLDEVILPSSVFRPLPLEAFWPVALPLPVLRPVVLAPISLVPGQAAAGLPSPGPAGGPPLPEVVAGLVPVVVTRLLPELVPAVQSVELSLPALAVVALAWQVVPLERPEVPEHSG